MTNLIESPVTQAMHAEATRLRSTYGLPAQVLSAPLCDGSQIWANHMAETGRLVHDSGVTEIIAWDSRRDANVLGCFQQWMGSPGHRAILLGDYQECGFAVARSNYGTYSCGRFGLRGVPIPIPKPKPQPPKPQPPKFSFWDWIRRFFGG